MFLKLISLAAGPPQRASQVREGQQMLDLEFIRVKAN